VGEPVNLLFRRADLVRDRDVLKRFNLEYLNWIGEAVQERYRLSLPDVLGTSIADYVDGALEKLCNGTPPSGVFYLVLDGETAVGIGGLRRVSDGVGEIKRIYVPKTARGGGHGARILDQLIDDARSFGYREVVLDTGPFMSSAHRLYEAAGFVDIPAYAEAEVPQALHHDWRFMRLKFS